jgi:hypothetical protein
VVLWRALQRAAAGFSPRFAGLDALSAGGLKPAAAN